MIKFSSISSLRGKFKKSNLSGTEHKHIRRSRNFDSLYEKLPDILPVRKVLIEPENRKHRPSPLLSKSKTAMGNYKGLTPVEMKKQLKRLLSDRPETPEKSPKLEAGEFLKTYNFRSPTNYINTKSGESYRLRVLKKKFLTR